MRCSILAALAALLVASAAGADSIWVEVENDTGNVGTSDKDSAQPGRVYQTTIDGTGDSEPLDIRKCDAWKIVGETVSGTYTPMECESQACTVSWPCNSGTTASEDEGCVETGNASAVVMVTSATASDVIVLVCGG